MAQLMIFTLAALVKQGYLVNILTEESVVRAEIVVII